MEKQHEYSMVIHTRGDVVGHFAVELEGPGISGGGRYVRGFAAENVAKAPASLLGDGISGVVRNDLEQVADKNYGYISSRSIP